MQKGSLMEFSQTFVLSEPWIEFLYWFGIVNLVVGVTGTALRLYAGRGLPLKRAVLFMAAGALFTVCSHRYRREMISRPAESPQAAVYSQK